jgi:hypothetical protein
MERPLFHLEIGPVVTCQIGQPAIIALSVLQTFTAARDLAQEDHCDLGAKARAQPQRVFNGILASSG